MAKPAMTQCCCCCGDLRIGSMAILIIQSILAMITIIISISTLSSGAYIDGDSNEHNRIIIDDSYSNNEFHMKKFTQTKLGLIIQLTSSLLAILFNAIGFYGCYKKTHNYILPWVVYNGIIHCLQFLLIIVAAIFIGMVSPAGAAVGVFIIGALIMGIFVYMWCVVYSYYAVLQEENNRGLYDKQPYRR